MEYYASMGRMLRHWATQTPDALGIAVDRVGEHDFAGWYRRSCRLANGITASMPQAAGQRSLAFVGKNAMLWGEVMAAASLIRASAAPLNWRLGRDEMQAIVSRADFDAIVVEADCMALLGLAVPADGAPRIMTGADSAPQPLEAWLQQWPETELQPDPDPEDIALIVYTSGTSGLPKGVEISNRAIRSNLESNPPWDVRAGDVVMVPAPVFHLSGTGWIFYCLGMGAASVHVLEIRPARVLELFASGKVNHALTVPTIIQMLARHEDARKSDYAGLKTLIYGGSPIPPKIAALAQDVFGCDLVQSYGMTETCGPITFLDAKDHRVGGQHLASAGRPAQGVELEIHDPETGRTVPTGAVGEVWMRSDLLFSSYRDAPQEYAAVMMDGGWFCTGDAGYLDEHGYLFLTDRVKDMVISGGENIYPVEIENVLAEHPGVDSVAVIGVPDEQWGETVKAVVVPGRDAPGAAELIGWCRERLAHYKCPTSVDFVEQLPRTASGKVLKRDLRKRYR